MLQFTAIVSNYAQNPGEDFEIERYALLEPNAQLQAEVGGASDLLPDSVTRRNTDATELPWLYRGKAGSELQPNDIRIR
jgi:hypothetical protein